MYLNYQNNCSKLPGIYKIINTHSNRIYIGQCKSFKQRWYGHSGSLKNNKHFNKFFQNDFNKCFEELKHDNFIEFHVIEIMENSSKEERNLREEHWISQYYNDREKCYNIREKVNDKERTCWSLNPEQRREKSSISMKKMWSEKSVEEKRQIAEKISIKNKGRKVSAEAIEKSRLKNLGRIPWNKDLKFPELSGINHPQFGKHHTEETKEKIRASVVDRVPWNKGKTGYTTLPCSEEKKKKISESNKGKKLSAEHIEKVQNTRKNMKINYATRTYSNIKLQSPDGSIYTEVVNLTEFSKQHSLNFKCLWKVLNGKAKSHRKWRLI